LVEKRRAGGRRRENDGVIVRMEGKKDLRKEAVNLGIIWVDCWINSPMF
jgi:hypothetical protein